MPSRRAGAPDDAQACGTSASFQTHARVANSDAPGSSDDARQSSPPARKALRLHARPDCLGTVSATACERIPCRPPSSTRASSATRSGRRPCARCLPTSRSWRNMSRLKSPWRSQKAKAGVIPQDAADAIKRSARADAIDLAKLKQETDLVGYPIVGVVHQLAKQCGDAGRYVHWGATTQDIMDTATVLQVRDALGIVEAGSGSDRDRALGACAKAPHHGDGGPHPSPARPASDLRLQSRGLARHDRPPSPAPEGAVAARPRRPVRGCRRHAGLARRQRASPCTTR